MNYFIFFSFTLNCLLWVGCISNHAPPTFSASTRTIKINQGRVGEGIPTILVLMPWNNATAEVLAGMRDEVGDEMALIAHQITKDSTTEDISEVIDQLAPKAVVLMNNPTVRLYRRYQQKSRPVKTPTALVLLTSFAEETSMGMKRTFGVTYEIPGLTLFTNLRALSASPIKRIGVVHRPGFRNFVAKQLDLLEIEEFELITEEVSSHPSPREIVLALNSLTRRTIDAIWILNDNGVLRADLLGGAWAPVLNRVSIPVVVGIRELIHPILTLGTYAVYPDHPALGTLAGSLLFKLMNGNWESDRMEFIPPISVHTTIDAKQVGSMSLKDNYHEIVDEVIGQTN